MQEILKVQKKDGYEIRTEKLTGEEYGIPAGEHLIKKSAYTDGGYYIGSPERAKQLIEDRGIKPELKRPDSRVCSVGFCAREQKWYGWSHRAICGFGIGDKFFHYFEVDDDNDPIPVYEDFNIENLDQAKQAAINFADDVA